MIHFFKVYTGCPFCRVPELGRCYGTSWRTQDFYVIRLPAQVRRFCFRGYTVSGSSLSDCVSFLCLNTVYCCFTANIRVNAVEFSYNIIKGTEYFVSL